MSSRTRRNTKKKSWGIAALVACLLLVAIGGTIAWLTAKSELTNKFTVGKINPVDPEKPGPGGEDIDPDDPKLDTKLNGNLYEPNWKDGDKLMPGLATTKDPYVGVGAGSEPAYVYVYVTNTMANNNNIYFQINDGWSPVDGQTTTTGTDGEYISGLFYYNGGLDASDSDTNVWTENPLFSEIQVKEEADQDDFTDTVSGTGTGSIKVQAYLHQMYSDTEETADLGAEALEGAKEAFGL